MNDLKQQIISLAKENWADIVGFAPKERFDASDPIFRIMSDSARKILDQTYFYPPAQHFYQCSICGRSCDLACYIHLEECGKLKNRSATPFRKREPWHFKPEDFE